VETVDRVSLDNYVAGVVPREMPASWAPAALSAQAVAARTYADNAIASPGDAEYDICATTSCQVYGGRAHYASNGTLLYSQLTSAATSTAWRILTYNGAPAFTQFSASNGGWSVAGGAPYLVAKADPYDTAARSGDPYIGATTTVKVSALASYFGLAKVASLTVVARDGHGTWLGRILSATVRGTDRSGKAKTVTADGFDLQYAFGLGTTWLRVLPPATK
jgi:SpoIID/LytB domain protein